MLRVVELNSLDGSRVLRGPRHERVGRARTELLGIPEVERSIFEGASNYTTRAIGGRLAPCNVVEPGTASELYRVKLWGTHLESVEMLPTGDSSAEAST